MARFSPYLLRINDAQAVYNYANDTRFELFHMFGL